MGMDSVTGTSDVENGDDEPDGDISVMACWGANMSWEGLRNR